MTALFGVFGGFVGMAGGHFVYDAAKLARREMRRRRKLATELATPHEVK